MSGSESRVLVEKAKGQIMQKQNMTEQNAYDYIRKLSQAKHLSMKRVADDDLGQMRGLSRGKHWEDLPEIYRFDARGYRYHREYGKGPAHAC